MKRSTFRIEGQTLTHCGTCPYTGDAFTRRYWLPQRGGYVRLDDSRHGDHPGTLGRQPTDRDGSTWRASNMDDLRAQVKTAWRRELQDR